MRMKKSNQILHLEASEYDALLSLEKEGIDMSFLKPASAKAESTT